MLKRKDGSKSQRGLWDNIRAKAKKNKAAGKKVQNQNLVVQWLNK